MNRVTLDPLYFYAGDVEDSYRENLTISFLKESFIKFI